ncbi:cytochrome P450 [Candidatus Woesearchaeota archaeon]|nr:cytochrome P450 [Candidatus Woesearchaeota archaeon]
MLEEERKQKSILDKPDILRREGTLTQPVKKGKGWLFKLILILIVAGLIYYLFTHPEIIRNPVNEFFGRFS